MKLSFSLPVVALRATPGSSPMRSYTLSLAALLSCRKIIGSIGFTLRSSDYLRKLLPASSMLFQRPFAAGASELLGTFPKILHICFTLAPVFQDLDQANFKPRRTIFKPRCCPEAIADLLKFGFVWTPFCQELNQATFEPRYTCLKL